MKVTKYYRFRYDEEVLYAKLNAILPLDIVKSLLRSDDVQEISKEEYERETD